MTIIDGSSVAVDTGSEAGTGVPAAAPDDAAPAQPPPPAPAVQEEPGGAGDSGAVAMPAGRASIVVGATTIAAGIVVGSIFEGFAGIVAGPAAGLMGVALAGQAVRRRRSASAGLMLPVGILAIGVAMLATAGADALFDVTGALREASHARRVMRPPAEFLAGHRALLGWAMGAVGAVAAWLALELRRPALGLLAPLPVVIVGAISVPTSVKLPVGVVTLVLFIVGLGALSSLDNALAGAQRAPLSYEIRRAVRAVPLVAGLVVLVVLLARSNLLFPPPLYDPVRDAQRPKAVPLSEVPDRPLFEVRSRSTGPWRIGLLDVYDGREWRIPAFSETSLARVPRDGVVDDDLGPGLRADFVVRDLGGAVLPGLPNTVAVVAVGPRLSYDGRTGTIRLAEGQIEGGLAYTVTAAATPTEAQLLGITASVPPAMTRFVEMPDPPPAVRALLDEAPESPAWARLDFVRRRLLETVTAAGAGTPAPVPPDKVQDLLAGSREGTPFEIVAAQAMLARWAGVPARIGYGYDGGEVLEENVREIRPRHGASWLEVWFPGFKWVPILGAPLKAKPSIDSTDPTNRDVTVLPSDQIAAQVFIPLRVESRSLFFDQVRRILFLATPLVLAAALTVLVRPAVRKALRRARRRAWAARCGPIARIEVAYAEFRDWCTDLGLPGTSSTPLGFLRWFAPDVEHTELAWLVTRAVYGDLRDGVTEEDAFAAEELSRVLRRRVSAAQPLTIRAVATVSRLSLREPWAGEARPLTRKERRELDRAA